MWKLSNVFSVVLVFVSFASELTSAQEVTARLHFNEGEPRKGAFCSEDEKQLIMESIADKLVEMQSSKIAAADYDEWCPSVCFPEKILFCQLMTKRCREQKERRKLSKATVSETIITGNVKEADESVVVFNEHATNHDGHRSLRRVLQRTRFTEDLSDAEKVTCSDIKRPLMRAISKELGNKLDTLCIRLLRQKLLLDCVVFV